jgi:hypothetical protein
MDEQDNKDQVPCDTCEQWGYGAIRLKGVLICELGTGGQWPRLVVNRCDACRLFDSDDDALQALLKELIERTKAKVPGTNGR